MSKNPTFVENERPSDANTTSPALVDDDHGQSNWIEVPKSEFLHNADAIVSADVTTTPVSEPLLTTKESGLCSSSEVLL
jgi:hypothetical protein